MNKQVKWMAVSIGLIVLYAFAVFGSMASSDNNSLGIGLLVAIGLAFIPANIARKKGREFWTWYTYGILLGIIAIIHAIVLKPISNTTEQNKTEIKKNSANVVPEQKENNKPSGTVSDVNSESVVQTESIENTNTTVNATNANPTSQVQKPNKNTKIVSAVGVGAVAMILLVMIFGFGSNGNKGSKWEYSKTTPNGLGKWYIKFTDTNDAIFKLVVDGEAPEYFIGLDFFVEDKYKGTGWTNVSDSSEMGINNFNDNLEVLLTKYPLIGEYKGKWVVFYNGVDLTDLKKRNLADFCWGELGENGLIRAKIKYEDLGKYLK